VFVGGGATETPRAGADYGGKQPQNGGGSSQTGESLVSCILSLRMLGLYPDTLIISHELVYMLSILNELTFQKKLPNFVRNNMFLDKK